MLIRLAGLVAPTLVVTSVMAAQVDDAAAVALAKPQSVVVAPTTPARRAALEVPVDAFYGFWNNGSDALLSRALSPRFVDHTLPPGRPQGPSGPAAASKAILAAVPDLRVAVVQRLEVDDRVVSHLRFTGHFTGEWMGEAGGGQPVDFVATDLLRVVDGRITDNWHLEDDPTFLQQIGVVPRSP